MCTSGIIIFLTNLTVQRAVFSVRGSGCTEGLQRGRASRGSRAERGWSSKLLAAGEKLFRRRSCCGQSRKLQSSGRRPPDRGRRRARSSDGWRTIRLCVLTDAVVSRSGEKREGANRAFSLGGGNSSVISCCSGEADPRIYKTIAPKITLRFLPASRIGLCGSEMFGTASARSGKKLGARALPNTP